MPDHLIFKAFFSYAHHDATTDPGLIEAFTTELENRVNAKLTNARFAIWRDEEGLRTGNIWNERLESEVSGSNILIVLLTPRWIESDYCRKEYSIFEEVEASRSVGEYVCEYVVPILARALEGQEKHFAPNQKTVYASLRERQSFHALAIELLSRSRERRAKLIDKLADDIEGMIDRLRLLRTTTDATNRAINRRSRPKREFDAAAHNFENVDFVRSAEVLLDTRKENNERSIFAQIEFVERLYVQGKRGRIDFGVRRAFLSVCNDGPGLLSKSSDFEGKKQNAYYVTLHEAPGNISVCMDPQSGRTIAELALPPAGNENYFSRVATATTDVQPHNLGAELIVCLNAEGLYLAAENERTLSPRMQTRIKAIMDIAAAKIGVTKGQSIGANGQFRRRLVVRERS